MANRKKVNRENFQEKGALKHLLFILKKQSKRNQFVFKIDPFFFKIGADLTLYLYDKLSPSLS